LIGRKRELTTTGVKLWMHRNKVKQKYWGDIQSFYVAIVTSPFTSLSGERRGWKKILKHLVLLM
jgi:hypothetical protein